MFKLKIKLHRHGPGPLDHYLTFDPFPTGIVSRFHLPLKVYFHAIFTEIPSDFGALWGFKTHEQLHFH
jgi:hypothetical protein